MAHHKQAKKRIIRNDKRRIINRDRLGRIRSAIKQVEVAIEKGDAKAASEALKAAQPQMHRGVSKGIMPKNAVARKLSRLNARIKAIA